MTGMLGAALRQTIREIRTRPLQAVVVIGTLALAIGVNAALFSATETLLVRQLPYADADRIVQVRGWSVVSFGPDGNFEVDEVFAEAPGVAATATFTPDASATLTGTVARQVRFAHVSGSFFDVLGVDLAMGAGLEGLDSGVRAAVLGHALWRTDFAADPAILDRDIVLNGIGYRVVGVAPPDVVYPNDSDLWVSYPAEFEFLGGAYGAEAIGRLEPGVDPEALGEAISEESSAERAEWAEQGYPVPPGTELRPLRDELLGSVGSTVLFLFGAAGLVLLLGALNLTGIWVARVIEREDELRTRRALGASRRRLVGQLVSEVTMLSLIGGLVAVGVAWGGTRLLARRLPPSIPGVEELGISLGTLAFAVLLAIVLGGGIGLIAGVRGSTAGAAGSKRGRTRRRVLVEKGIIVVQGATALVLVAGSLLAVRSLQRLVEIPLGFEPDATLTLTVRVPASEVGREGLGDYADAVLSRLGELPGAEVVGWTSRLPMMSGVYSGLRHRDPENPDVARSARISSVSPSYFEAVGIPVLAGEGLSDDMADDEIVVDEAFADTLFGSPQAAVGRTIEEATYPDRVETWVPRRIRGVVGSVRAGGPKNGVSPGLYVPQDRWPSRELGFAVRVRGNPSELRQAAIDATLDVNPNIVPFEVRSLREATDRLLVTDRTLAQVISGFSIAGLLLAALGLYGVVGRQVAGRQRELGIRLAIGADPGRLVHALVRGGVLLGALAAVVGVPAALLAAPALEARLHEMTATDPLVLAASAIAVLGVTTVAAWVPARRAARISPRDALTTE